MRRRFAWIQGGGNFRAAILYSVLNGGNTEVWLQDADLAPALIATFPPRIALSGFSATINVPNLGSDSALIGYLRTPSGTIGIDIPRNTVNGGLDDRKSIEVSTTTPIAFFNNSNLIMRTPGGGSNNLFSVVSSGVIQNNGLVSSDLSRFIGTGEIVLTGNHQDTSGGQPPTVTTTTTILSCANFLDARLQRRAGGTFVYMKNRPYASLSALPPLNQAFGRVNYWVDGSMVEFESPIIPDPDPSDITGSLLSYTDFFQLDRITNEVSSGVFYSYEGDLFDLINGGAAVTASIDIGGPSLVPITVRGVTADANDVLSVAVYNA